MAVDPITYPTITIGGVVYTLKFSILAEYVADNLKVDLRQFFAGLRTTNAGSFALFLQLFSAMVAHHFQTLKQPIPTPEQWAAALDAEPPERIGELCQAVGDALRVKMQASAAQKLREPAPIQGHAGQAPS